MDRLTQRLNLNFEKMNAVFSMINEIHPLIVIGNFLFEFLAIHPFQDGNGRMSRLLTNLLLLQQGYKFMPYISHESLIESKKVDYYIALGKTQQTWKSDYEDIYPWIDFFLGVIKEQGKQSISLSNGENIGMYLSEKPNKVWNYIVENHPCSRKAIVEGIGISEGTVKQAISKLIMMGKFIRICEQDESNIISNRIEMYTKKMTLISVRVFYNQVFLQQQKKRGGFSSSHLFFY